MKLNIQTLQFQLLKSEQYSKRSDPWEFILIQALNTVP